MKKTHTVYIIEKNWNWGRLGSPNMRSHANQKPQTMTLMPGIYVLSAGQGFRKTNEATYSLLY